jgi:hypothetical protein
VCAEGIEAEGTEPYWLVRRAVVENRCMGGETKDEGWCMVGCAKRLSHNPDLRRIADSKIFVYTSRQRHGINKKILSCFFEKRSIVLQSAVNRRPRHDGSARPPPRGTEYVYAFVFPLSEQFNTSLAFGLAASRSSSSVLALHPHGLDPRHTLVTVLLTDPASFFWP